MFASWYLFKTHCHVCGTPQSGKSKFCELCVREKIKRGLGVTFFDWHGKTYHELIPYLAYMRPKRPVCLIDLSDPTQTGILPYDPFALPKGANVSAHVSRMTDLIVKPWGGRTDDMPRFERIVKMVLHYCAVSGESLHHGARLLEYPKRELREHAIDVISDDYIKQQWKQLQYIRTFKEWMSQVESTQNRLGRFIGSQAIKLVAGLGSSTKDSKNFDIGRAIDESAIVLVNLAPSDNYLSDESAKVFASLLLAGYFRAAMARARNPKPHFLYLDECQNYLTEDAPAMLDQATKSGLRLTLIHHHMGQFHEKVHLQTSIDTDARCKVTFAGVPVEAAKRAAEQYFHNEVNERKKKDDTYRTTTEWMEEPADSITTTVTEHGETVSTTSGTRMVASQRREIDGQVDYTLEEKISQLASRFLNLNSGECYIKVPGELAYRYEVPFVRPYLPPADKVLQFMQEVLKNHILLHEAEKILEAKERTFLERSREYEPRGARPKKRQAHLHPQS
jgi:hypothetical protein